MRKRLGTFFKVLFLGQEESRPYNKLNPAIQNQWLNVTRVWQNKHYKDFGLERIIRLSLALLQFIFPGLYIRHFSGVVGGLLGRKIGVEIYILIKLLIPIIFLKLRLFHYGVIALLEGYMCIETMIYLSCLIFLSNEFSQPISYRRSLTTLFINYVEVCLEYAVIYAYCDNLHPCFNNKVTSVIQYIYFSLTTSSTVGFGDITPVTSHCKLLVMSQIIISLLFIVLFFNFFASRIQELTYYNSKPHHGKGDRPNV